MVCKTVKASFPSTSERIVASALLLLSSSSNDESCSPESYGSSRFSSQKSFDGCSSTNTSSDGESYESETATSPEVCARQLKVVPNVARFNDLKLKIVKKKRSKSICISSGQKMNPTKLKCISAQASSECTSEITTADTSSCLSSTSTAQSPRNKANPSYKPRKPAISGHLGRLSAAILRVLLNGSTSEVRIRKVLGDSPSTSKALRMLLKSEEVKRSGTGGRHDPYIYMLAR